MKIMALGIDYTTGKPLIPPLDEGAFSDYLDQALGLNIDHLREQTRAAQGLAQFRGEIEQKPTPNLANPRMAGWTYLINANDPQAAAIIDRVRPLAEHRGMPDPSKPLLYHGEPYDEWFDWLGDNYSPLVMDPLPLYVLIVGGPDQVSFHFQSFLSSAAAVGRLAFDNLDDLGVYIDKVIRLEKAPEPVPTRSAIFFAPDGGPLDPTYFSRRYMAEPLIEHVRNEAAFSTTAFLGFHATKQRLDQALRGSKPALVYTASHGLGAPDQELSVQQRLNGAICCQNDLGLPLANWLYTAEDVPTGEPFLEGAIFFQFACYGYGTPAESDYMHWLKMDTFNAKSDFVAALPKKLLAHSRGPLAFIGHVDTAWLHGFNDPEEPFIMERWHPRIAPYLNAVDELLACRPPGLAMREMCKRYDIANAQLTNTYDRLQRGKLKRTAEFKTRLASLFITRSDAQNYMVFGDPAVQPRIME